jgi:hypothetical protein
MTCTSVLYMLMPILAEPEYMTYWFRGNMTCNYICWCRFWQNLNIWLTDLEGIWPATIYVDANSGRTGIYDLLIKREYDLQISTIRDNTNSGRTWIYDLLIKREYDLHISTIYVDANSGRTWIYDLLIKREYDLHISTIYVDANSGRTWIYDLLI